MRGDGVLLWRDLEQAALDRHDICVAERIARHNATRRVICADRTRKGQPFRLELEPGRNHCKFHGGGKSAEPAPLAKPRLPPYSVSDGPAIASNRGLVQRVANVRFYKVPDRRKARADVENC